MMLVPRRNFDLFDDIFDDSGFVFFGGSIAKQK